MSRIQQLLHNDVQALSLLRDEMLLQAHLFRAEARTRWQELEVSWDELKVHLQRGSRCQSPNPDCGPDAGGYLEDQLRRLQKRAEALMASAVEQAGALLQGRIQGEIR